MSSPRDGSTSPSHPALRSDQSPAIATATGSVLTAQPIVERCDHCGAGVDGNQRYCVQCGAHQRSANDPTARWFAAARRAKAAPAPLPAGAATTGRTIPAGVAAVLIALLPVSAGIGVIVGRGSDDSGKQIIAALKAAGAGGGLAAGTAQSADAATGTTGDAATAADDAPSDDDAEAKTTKKVDGIELTDKQAPVIASGPTGSARKLTGTKSTQKDLDESKEALKKIESKKGDEYVEQQRDLPDSIVIP